MAAEISNMYNYNRINMGERIPLSTPLVIQLEPSGYCNLECRFCPCGNSTSRAEFDQSIMDIDMFDTFIRQCKQFENKIKILRFIGIGEPLVNKNIITFVKKASESSVFEKIEITTNGTLLTRDLSDSLIENGLDVLLVSLEGTTREQYKKMAGRDIDTEALRDNLKYFYRKSRDTRTKLYIKTVNEAIDSKDQFIKEYGEFCDYIYVENVIENWPEFNAGTHGDVVRYDYDEYKHRKKICIQPFKLMCIAANGDVMPCSVDWKRVLILGNLKSDTLTEIWNGKKHRDMMLSLLMQEKKDFCKVCKYTIQNQPDNIDEYVEEIIKRLGEHDD